MSKGAQGPSLSPPVIGACWESRQGCGLSKCCSGVSHRRNAGSKQVLVVQGFDPRTVEGAGGGSRGWGIEVSSRTAGDTQ